ncbi:MAG: hypothetical protein U1G07_13355 [Verrucomicrobiota bacterium]
MNTSELPNVVLRSSSSPRCPHRPTVFLALAWREAQAAADAALRSCPDRSAGRHLCSHRFSLVLLTYFYATGVYASEEVETSACCSREIQQIFGRNVPSAPALQRFRRQHRHVLTGCLTEVLLRVLEADRANGIDRDCGAQFRLAWECAEDTIDNAILADLAD